MRTHETNHETNQAPARVDEPRGLRRWWFDQSLGRKGMIVVAVPLAALMGITTANLLLQQSETHERTVSLQARALDSAASQVLIDALNAETGIRGYVATRDPVFLAPYNLTLTRIGAERRALRDAAVIEGDGRQQRAVDATVGSALSELAQLRSAVSHGISGERLHPALTNEKKTMDQLRLQVATLASGPAALVASQRNKLTVLQTRIELLDIVGLALGLLAGVAGRVLFTSGIASRLAGARRTAAAWARESRSHQSSMRMTKSASSPSHCCGPKTCWLTGLRS